MRGYLSVACRFGVLALLFFAFLFTDIGESSSWGSICRITLSIVRDAATQWIVVSSLVCYLVAFSILKHRSSSDGNWLRRDNPDFWLGAFGAFAVLRYAFSYHTASISVALVVLLAGAVFSRGLSVWVRWSKNRIDQRITELVALPTFFLSATAVLPEAPKLFQYHEVLRWSGPWNNPNLFGLLMGSAFILSVAMGIGKWKSNARFTRKAICTLIYSLAALVSGYALLRSYSRGAWLGTGIGMAYLYCSKLHDLRVDSTESLYLWCRKNCWLLVIVFALANLTFWQFRFTELRPASRLFSMANISDFSWRNRITAWEGAMRMMGERPWIGYGWGNAEPVYEHKFRPPQLDSGAAIQMNDYFMLGISAGVPALICFLIYAGLSLRSNPKSKAQSPELMGIESTEAYAFDELAWLQATCRAGAIVLLVGFFFDGGLFKLATGSVFWILLELGRVDTGKARQPVRRSLGVDGSVRAVVANNKEICVQRSDALCHHSRWEIWLRRSAWVLGVLAVSESAILLSTPFFGVNNTTLAISRRYLVPPSAVEDLNRLAANVDWSSRKLRPLLQHASLANYNRQIINWKLDEQIYRDYVLNPLIEPQRDGQLGWRRKLWEYFYLPIRKENDPASAAQIVLKFLHQRISLVEKGPVTIEEMWQQKNADAKGFEALKVAAFRSVGIPAGLNNEGHAELFADGKWQIPPQEH
jgi:O-antigen ligase